MYKTHGNECLTSKHGCPSHDKLCCRSLIVHVGGENEDRLRRRKELYKQWHDRETVEQWRITLEKQRECDRLLYISV